METSIALSIYLLKRGVTSLKMHNCHEHLTQLCSMHIDRAMAVSVKGVGLAFICELDLSQFYIQPRAGLC